MAVNTIEGAPVVVTDDRRAMTNLNAFLRRYQTHGADALMLVTSEGQQQVLPPSLIPALDALVTLLARGDDVALVPTHKELTTYQAAAILNVSRPFVIRLLDAGVIPSTRVGTHRRVRLRDVLAYRQQRAEKNKGVLDEMLSYAQEQGGYE